MMPERETQLQEQHEQPQEPRAIPPGNRASGPNTPSGRPSGNIEDDSGDEQPSRARGGNARSYFEEHPNAKWVIAFVVLVIVVGGILFWLHYRSQETTDDAQIEGHLVPVSARVGGTIIALNVKDNQYVEAGTVMAQLDPKDYQVALEKAQADLADAQAQAAAAGTSVPIESQATQSQLTTAQAGVAGALQEQQAAKARVNEAQANFNKAHADLLRFQQLVQKDEISRQEYDSAVAAESAASANLAAAQAALATSASRVLQARSQAAAAGTAPQQVAVSRSRAQAAQAMVQTRQAELDQARLNLDYTSVKAPVSGIVRKSVEVGQLVQPGQPLISIVPLNDIWVIGNFKETQLKKMKPGQRCTIHVDATGKDYDGHVDSIGGATSASYSLLPPENATGNYVKVVQRMPVKIVFENNQDPDHRLRPGMSTEPTVHLQ